MEVDISAANVSAMFLLNNIHLTVSESASKDAKFGMSEVNEEHISRFCCMKLIFSEHTIIKSNGC